MTELEQIYRQAPRQVSPDRLDDIVLARATQRVAGKKQSRLLMTPVKTLAVSFSVVGLGVALLLRNGVPPLEQNPSSIHRGIAEQGDVAQTEADAIAGNSILEDQAEPSVQRIETPGLTASIRAETGQDSMSALVTADDALPVDQPPQSMKSVANSSDKVLAETLSEDVNDQDAVTSSTSSGVQSDSAEATAVVKSTAEAFAEEAESMQPTGRTEAVDELIVAQSQIADNTRSAKNVSRAVAPAFRAETLPSMAQQSAAEVSGLSVRVDTVIVPPDSTDWVLRQSAQSFTLQLATASSLSYLQEYAESLSLAPPFYIVTLASNDATPDFGLLYGLFDDDRQALKAVKTLDSEARRFRPWVRRLGKLQREVLLP